MMTCHPSLPFSRLRVLLAICPFLFHKTCEAQSPTPAPTLACPSEMAAWRECLADNNLESEACIDCYSPYYDRITNGTTCGKLSMLICNQIDACTSSCGTCGSYIEAYETCSWEGCFLTCWNTPAPTAPSPPTSPVAPPPTSGTFPPTTAPSADPCRSEDDALRACIVSSGDGIVACRNCIFENLPETIPTCEASENYTCGAFDACPECGDCEAEFVAITNCGNEGACAAFTCPPAGPTTAPGTAPTTTPTLALSTSRPVESPDSSPGEPSPSPTPPSTSAAASFRHHRHRLLTTVAVAAGAVVPLLALA